MRRFVTRNVRWSVWRQNGLEMTLDRAIELALPSLRSAGRAVSVEQLFADFAASKEYDWSEASKRSFATSAKTFLKRWGGRMISTIDADELEVWYEVTFPTSGYRAHEVRTIRPAFSWAVRRRLLQESPFSRMEGVRVKRKPIVIYSPDEVRRLMARVLWRNVQRLLCCFLLGGDRRS